MSPRLILAVVTTILQEVAIAAIILWVLPQFGIRVPVSWLIVLLVLWSVTDTFLYWVGSRALRRKPIAGLPSMIGSRGKVIKQLSPNGVIKINSELWQAKSIDGNLNAGTGVTVVDQDGLNLLVSKTADPEGK